MRQVGRPVQGREPPVIRLVDLRAQVLHQVGQHVQLLVRRRKVGGAARAVVLGHKVRVVRHDGAQRRLVAQADGRVEGDGLVGWLGRVPAAAGQVAGHGWTGEGEGEGRAREQFCFLFF